jgi:hypothetical protein
MKPKTSISITLGVVVLPLPTWAHWEGRMLRLCWSSSAGHSHFAVANFTEKATQGRSKRAGISPETTLRPE